MRYRRYGTVLYGVEKDPKGGWRAWWQPAGVERQVHECATRIGATYAARRGARQMHERQVRTEMWRKLNGYTDV